MMHASATRVSVPECFTRGWENVRRAPLRAALTTVWFGVLAAMLSSSAFAMADGSWGSPVRTSGCAGASYTVWALVFGFLTVPLSFGYVTYFLQRGRGENASSCAVMGGLRGTFALLGALVMGGVVLIGPALGLFAVGAAIAHSVPEFREIGFKALDPSVGVLALVPMVCAGLYIARTGLLMSLTPLLIVDQRLGAARALSASMLMVRGNVDGLLTLIVASVIILGLSALAPPLLLLTIPWVVSSFGCFYDKLVVAYARPLSLRV